MPSRWRRGGDLDVNPASIPPPARAKGLARYVEGVFTSVVPREPPARHPGAREPGTPELSAGAAGIRRVMLTIRIAIMLMVLVTVPLVTAHRNGADPRSLAIYSLLAVIAVTLVVWLRAENGCRTVTGALIVLAAAGGVLAGLSPDSPAVAVGCVVASAAAVQLSIKASLATTAELLGAFLITGLVSGAPAGALVGYTGAFIGLWAFGFSRRAYALRAEQAEQALEQTRRAHAAVMQAAALAERARIAREIHDVLAHSLAAVSVNLQAAEGLLGELPADRPELAKAIECVERAGAFTREGLADARRAILALRDGDAASTAPRPLADQLRSLAGDYRADGDAAVEFAVSGDPRPVAAEAALTVYRTAQEALTNARKHAPGQPVSLTLEFTPSQVTVDILNPLPPAGTVRPLAGAGSGYGLIGLQERAALGGGSLIAGPAGGQWRVSLKMPA